MAYKLIWSPASRDDLHDIVVFISRDNLAQALTFGYRLISETDKLQSFPEIGRIVREYRNPILREIIARLYTSAANRYEIQVCRFKMMANIYAG